MMTHESAETRFLHVANGTSTTGLIKAAGIPGTVSLWADPLYEGPVPGGLTDGGLLDVRARFLGGDAAVDPVNDLRQWREAIQRPDAYDELVLWFEHDLFDQLNLIQLLSWIREHLPEERVVSLVCIESFPGRAAFKGLGELTPEELAPLLEARQRVSESQYTLADRAWRAFRGPTPEALDRLRRSDTAALPYLAAALSRFLQEYPWATDGLSRTERRLLELAGRGSIRLTTVFPRMHEGEEAYYITDASLAALAGELSRSSPALLTLTRDPAVEGILAGVVTLTAFGRGVMTGRDDRISTCGIDRWFGGVHLQTGGTIWRWDDAHQRVVSL